MGTILDESRGGALCPIHSERPVFATKRSHAPRHMGRMAHAHTDFRPMPTRKVSADLSRDALGLIGLHTLKFALKASTNWL